MTFSKEIITVLDYLAQKFGVAIDWTSENVMPYLQDLCSRYIDYEIYTSIFVICSCAFITLLLGIILIPLHRASKKLDYDGSYAVSAVTVWMWVAFAISIVVTIGVGIAQGIDIVECKTLPEKVILEYIQSLMESK